MKTLKTGVMLLPQVKDIFPENADGDMFLRTKLLAPSSDSQAVIEGLQEVHDISQSNLLSKLNENLVSLGIPEADIKTVTNEVTMDDLFRTCNTHIENRNKETNKASTKLSQFPFV